MRVSGYGDISGVCGYNGGDAWQTSTLRVYASSGGMVVTGGSKNGTSQYNVHCSGSATANLTLIGSAAKDYYLSGSIAPTMLGEKVKGRISQQENFMQYSATITHNILLGSFLRIGTLTGDVLVNAPTGGTFSTGDEITLVTTQDSTGNRSVTFSSDFKGVSAAVKTANAVNVWKFSRIGSNWVQTSNSSYV